MLTKRRRNCDKRRRTPGVLCDRITILTARTSQTMAATNDHWALILGGSSGIGLATATKLAADGYHLLIVHRDRAGARAEVERGFDALRRHSVTVVTQNVDALSAEGRQTALNALEESMGSGRLRVVLHSIALGNLKPLPALSDDDFAGTIYNMGTSLATWVRALHERQLFAKDARVIALTSEGEHVAWPGYAAVSAAKAALSAVARAIAREYAPFGIRCNVVQAGVTDTPALRKIPGHEGLIAAALARNPFGRLTSPTDVAGVISLLAKDEAAWINGALLRVDGGEAVSGASVGDV